MFQNIFITICLFSSSILLSQVDEDSTNIIKNDINGRLKTGIIDGVYLKKSITEEKIYYDDYDTSIYNRNFVLTQFGEYDLQVVYDSIRKYYGESKPAKIGNAIYIDPISIISNNPNSKIFFNDLFEKNKEKLILPNSIYSLVDTTQLTNEEFTTKLVLDAGFDFPFEEYLTPYYIKKTEVTNKEYREFVNWVKDSISRELIYKKLKSDDEASEYLEYEDYFDIMKSQNAEWVELNPSDRFGNREFFPLNWNKKIDYQNEEIRDIIDEYFYPEVETRFYKRKEIDTRKLKFRYYWIDEGNQNSSIRHSKGNKQRKIIDEVINIYPDTTVWNDFLLDSLAIKNVYFWHPAYDNYPVVGLTYKQVQAFLHWKSMMLQKEMNSKRNSYKVICNLPNDVQWEMVSTMKKDKRNLLIYPSDYKYTSDDSWITDLILSQSFNIDTLVEITENEENSKIVYRDSRDYLNQSISNSLTLRDGFIPQYLFEVNSDDSYFAEQNQDENGIAFMGGNVSEWVDCNYQQWKYILEYRHTLLKADSIHSAKFIMNKEMYFDALNNCENGIMVRGSNWYDHRFLSYGGKNVQGMNAKRFVDPNKAFATLGFRYVIYIRRLEE